MLPARPALLAFATAALACASPEPKHAATTRSDCLSGPPSQERPAELDLDDDGATDLWISYDAEARVAAWRGRNDSGRLPTDRPPPELARLVPAFDPPAAPECMARPEVEQYLAGVKERVYGRWSVSSRAPSRTRLSFSLDQNGAVVGACVREADDLGAGAGVVGALFASGPFPPMPERAQCLARHHLIGTFATEPKAERP